MLAILFHEPLEIGRNVCINCHITGMQQSCRAQVSAWHSSFNGSLRGSARHHHPRLPGSLFLSGLVAMECFHILTANLLAPGTHGSHAQLLTCLGVV